MWDSCFQAPRPTPRSLLMKMIHKQTVLTLLWRTNAFLGTFVILRPHIIYQSPFASLTTNLFTVFMVAFNTCLKQSIRADILFFFPFFFFDVPLSLKDECAPKKDYNRMPVLCVFLVSLKSSDGLLSVHVWAQVDLFYLFIYFLAGFAACVCVLA